MKKLAMVLGFGLLAACGGDKFDDAISKMESFKSKMCDCKDAACADAVHEDYKKWEDTFEKSMTEEDLKKMDPSKMEKAETLDKERKDCRRKAKGDK